MADLRAALYALVPELDYMSRYEGVHPTDSDQPPWMILTVSLGVSDVSQARQVISHEATLEARIAALTPEQVDIAALTLLDAVTGARPVADGVSCGALNNTFDSETYNTGDSGGVIGTVTASAYSVRVLRWKTIWSRHG